MNLFTKHNVAAVPNRKLYNNTIKKFPNHSISPKSPSKSKFVIPKKKFQINDNHSLNYNRKKYDSPNILDSSGKAELNVRRKAQFTINCDNELNLRLGLTFFINGIVYRPTNEVMAK